MLKNDVLLSRIAKLIAMNYGTSELVVYKRIMETGSIDVTLQELQVPDFKVGQDS